MTSTGFSLGFGDNQKPSSKVLRPPGGGSSDIFGAENAGTPRTVRNHMASNIFGSTQDAPVKNNGDGVRRGGKNGDSYNRLFGESDRPFTPAKNHLKSNIPLGGDSPAKINNGNNAATNGHTNGKAENNNGVQQNGTSKTDGNPVTGEGYNGSGGAEVNTAVPSLNGAKQVINKNRIPPGGYSSGLWQKNDDWMFLQ